ncbi:MAG: hypothetical protein ACUVTL_02940 [Thermoproteota archaeon]
MLSAYSFINVVYFTTILGVVPPLSILKRLRREELSYEKVMEIWLGKIGRDARFSVSEESFKKMSYDIESYVALLALLSKGRLKVRSDLKNTKKSPLLNIFRHLHDHS